MKPETSFTNDRATEIVNKTNNTNDLKINIDGGKDEKPKDHSPLIMEAAVPEVQEKSKDVNGKDNV